MSKKSCILYPEIEGKPSKLYKDLLKRQNVSRPLANYLYACYVAEGSDIAVKMDEAGYIRNSQGQHSEKDYWKFIDGTSIVEQLGNLDEVEKSMGATDKAGRPIDYTDAREALEKAHEFNLSSKAFVAVVNQHRSDSGTVYNITLSEKNARTHNWDAKINEMLKIWDINKQVLNSIGVDIDALSAIAPTTFNAFNADLYKSLKNLQRLSIDNMYKNDAMILFNFDADSLPVQRLVKSFGSIENAAQALSDINHRIGDYSLGQKTLLKRAIDHCKKFKGLDIDKLGEQVEGTKLNLALSNEEESIRDTLHKLHKKYRINKEEIQRTDRKIKKLSDAAVEAVFTLERQARELEKRQGDLEESKRIESLITQLGKEIRNKKYYRGLLNFLDEANKRALQMDETMEGLPTTGTELDKIFDKARILQDIKTIYKQYYRIVAALANEHIRIDESIDKTDIENIRNTAKQIVEVFDKWEDALDNATQNTMVDLVKQVVGRETPNGQITANVVRMAAVDTGRADYLYSMGRSSNPIINAAGNIIRNAQNQRNDVLIPWRARVDKVTDKLYKSGSTSEFMYEDDGHIISDIDWALYYTARDAKKADLMKNGYKGINLKMALKNWEEANTVDLVVDKKSGRTEKIPNEHYRKEFPKLTPAQQEYYNTMMQIKGEIGTLLPNYAQHHFLPPQIRRGMLDALGHATSLFEDYKQFGKDVGKAFKNKAQDMWTVREDDTDYNYKGIINGEEYEYAESDYDDAELRQIPIFYVNKLKDQGELLKDFSSGIMALAGTAANYDAMSNVCQVIEFMRDFVVDQDAAFKDRKADFISMKGLTVAKEVYRRLKNTNTKAIMEGFVSQHIYGQKLDPDQMIFPAKWSKLIQSIMGYTSFKALGTNIPGAFANFTIGELQMLREAFTGQFYNAKDFAWAHSKLFGGAGVSGEIMELLTNNMKHKATLFRELFDPIQESYSDTTHKRYYKSMFRQMVGHDCSFIGYGAGEYLLHYINMYSVLHNKKVKYKGKSIPLYDAFEVKDNEDGSSELIIKEGVTRPDGGEIDAEYLSNIRKLVRGVNQMTHGSMNEEDKGLIHQQMLGRLVMQFRQWMVDFYSVRYRKAYKDDALGTVMEGYWRTAGRKIKNTLISEDTREMYHDPETSTKDVMKQFIKDFTQFSIRAKAEWLNPDMSEMERYNIKRVLSEMGTFFCLLGLSFALGEPDKHKKEFWRRWWIYQTKRMLLETEAGMPNLYTLSSGLTILQSPMASVDFADSFLYVFYGLFNGDLFEEIKSGKHKGENRYWRNVQKYDLPAYKNIEQWDSFYDKDALFQVFEHNPGKH